MVFAAATVSADGALAGDRMPPYPIWLVNGFTPILPAAMTTMMPARDAASTACTSGSDAAGAKGGWPSDRLMTSTPSASRFTIANSIAAMTSLVEPVPLSSRTRRPIRWAAGATPRTSRPRARHRRPRGRRRGCRVRSHRRGRRERQAGRW